MRADYGLDAPPVVRNLLLAALVGLGLWAGIAAGLWSGTARIPIGGDELRIVLGPAGLAIGLACLGMAVSMIWSSRVGKVRERERLLDTLTWTGSERVLDVGCGRGLMLLGAAKRLRDGRAVGVDLWRAEDLAGNAPSAVWANAAIEGVTARVALETADMRQLPFPASSFDVVLSQTAVHNLSSAAGRQAAVEEMARVLRPGGQVLLSDIRHVDDYAAILHGQGLDVSVERSVIGRWVWGLLTFGRVLPAVARGRRPVT